MWTLDQAAYHSCRGITAMTSYKKFYQDHDTSRSPSPSCNTDNETESDDDNSGTTGDETVASESGIDDKSGTTGDETVASESGIEDAKTDRENGSTDEETYEAYADRFVEEQATAWSLLVQDVERSCRLELARELGDHLSQAYDTQSILHIISQVQSIYEATSDTTKASSDGVTKALSDGVTKADPAALRAAAKEAQERIRQKGMTTNPELDIEWTNRFGRWKHDNEPPNPHWIKSLKSKSGYKGVTQENRGATQKQWWRVTMANTTLGRFNTCREACDEYLNTFKAAAKKTAQS